MTITLRTQSVLLVIPLALALSALVWVAMTPYVVVHDDIERVENDLDATLAILEFTANFAEQSREYADLIVSGSPHDADEARADLGPAREALLRWRKLADASFPSDRRTIVQIEAEHVALTAAGERIIEYVRQGRSSEATAVIFEEVRPRMNLVIQLSDRARLTHTRDMSRYVDRMTGGIKYSGFLRFAGFQEGLDDLEGQVVEVLASAGLRSALQTEVAKCWDYFLSGDPALVVDRAVLLNRSATYFHAWRSAVLDYEARGKAGDRERAAEVAFTDEVRSAYLEMEERGDRVFALVAAGAKPAARKILLEEMEFEETRTAKGLDTYFGREIEGTRQKLSFLRDQTARVRIMLGCIGAALLLVGFAVPWFASRAMIGPIVNLQRAAQRIGQGDFDARVPVSSVAELGALATTFNAMTSELQSSRESLRRSEERFALAARATSDMIWDFDLVTGAVLLSGGFAEHADFTDRGPTAEADWMARVHPDDRERMQSDFARSLAGRGNLHTTDYRFARADGTYAFVVDRAHIVRNAEHTPVRVIGATSDVTERKNAEKSVAALSRMNEMILDSVGEGILGVDANGDVISVNPAAAAMLGRNFDGLFGKSLRDLIHPSARDVAAYRWEESPVMATLRRGTRETSDSNQFARADGSRFPVDFTSNPMYDEHGQTIGAVLAFRDITQKYEVDRLKSQFVSTVSHELRTPLTSIRGSLGLLSGGLLGTVSPKGQRMLEIAVANTDRLVRLINDILDIERLNSGALTLSMRPLDVTDVMQQAAEVMKPIADTAGVTLIWSPFRGTIAADQDRMVQTLTNLLSNAIKFSAAATTVTMTAERVGSMLRFRIADQGRGIPVDKLESVFERFQQVDASDSRDKGGSGLGLPICRSIVQQHGGKLWVESVFGKGSTFIFTIPLAEEPLAKVDGSQVAGWVTNPFDTDDLLATIDRVTGHSNSSPRILLVGDDMDLARVLKTAFEQAAVTVQQAANGVEAMEMAMKHPPDLIILLDVVLPRLNGFSVVKWMKEDEALRNIPVVIYSGSEIAAVDRSRLELGPTAFFTKSRIAPEMFEQIVLGLLNDMLEKKTELAHAQARIAH